jgi:predicted methyltransferase
MHGAALGALALTAACANMMDGLGGGGPAVDAAKLEAILAARPEEQAARDRYRHPDETLAFFDIAPDAMVVETLPGNNGPGWYTYVLAPYLAPDGALYGANYPTELWGRIYGDIDDETAAMFDAFPEDFVAATNALPERPETVGAYIMGDPPAELEGEVDAVLYIRSLHHLNRFDPTGLDAEAADAFALLRPGGVAGVVQHRAPEGSDDVWADGDNGYLKTSRVVEAFTGAGFVLEAEAEINANPLDQPTEGDFVWRLPPTLGMGETRREEFVAIGETDRMTLRFRKPS